jgi:hypothetical protein
VPGRHGDSNRDQLIGISPEPRSPSPGTDHRYQLGTLIGTDRNPDQLNLSRVASAEKVVTSLRKHGPTEYIIRQSAQDDAEER